MRTCELIIAIGLTATLTVALTAATATPAIAKSGPKEVAVVNGPANPVPVVVDQSGGPLSVTLPPASEPTRFQVRAVASNLSAGGEVCDALEVFGDAPVQIDHVLFEAVPNVSAVVPGAYVRVRTLAGATTHFDRFSPALTPVNEFGTLSGALSVPLRHNVVEPLTGNTMLVDVCAGPETSVHAIVIGRLL